jgi:hypothetical protein
VIGKKTRQFKDKVIGKKIHIRIIPGLPWPYPPPPSSLSLFLPPPSPPTSLQPPPPHCLLGLVRVTVRVRHRHRHRHNHRHKHKHKHRHIHMHRLSAQTGKDTDKRQTANGKQEYHRSLGKRGHHHHPKTTALLSPFPESGLLSNFSVIAPLHITPTMSVYAFLSLRVLTRR